MYVSINLFSFQTGKHLVCRGSITPSPQTALLVTPLSSLQSSGMVMQHHNFRFIHTTHILIPQEALSGGVFFSLLFETSQDYNRVVASCQTLSFYQDTK